MIRPLRFGYNPQTSDSNAFQNEYEKRNVEYIRESALKEFNGLVEVLAGAGIVVHVFEEDPTRVTPDAVFPNNWVSFQPDDRIVVYPMMAENRRRERRSDIFDFINVHYRVSETIDLTAHEQAGQYLEGTGSIVFDHINKLAYANESPRTNKALFFHVCEKLGYEPVSFRAQDPTGVDIYHTNVMMSVGEGYAIVCLEVIDKAHRAIVVDKLVSSGLEIIEITFEQVLAFAGNTMQLQNHEGSKFIIMSDAALQCLEKKQVNKLESFGTIIHSNLEVIEKIGGGSARCMIAGIHLSALDR